MNYEGTLIIVSHDRDFLDGLVDKIYEFKNKKLREHLGGIYDFLRRKNISSLRELEISQNSLNSNLPGTKEISNNKQDYFDKKEFEKILRKAINKLEKCENNIEKIEAEIKGLDIQMGDTENLHK
jgi:ATP-binding cassette subfamily F protein 3